MKRLPLDLPALVRQVLSEDPDPYAALSEVLNHARAVTGFGGGAVLRLTDTAELEVIVSQGRFSTTALKAFKPSQGRLAAIWGEDDNIPSVSSAVLSDVAGQNRLALVYARLKPRNMPKSVLLLVRPVPPGQSADEALPHAEAERLRDLMDVAVPLLGQVSEYVRLRRDHVDLVRRAQDAKAAVRTRDAFLARMSHDLRTPLSAILGFAQLLEMESLDQEQRKSVEHILKAGRRLQKVLTQAIEIAYAAAGKLTLTLQPVDLATLLRDCAAMVKGEAVDAGVTVYVAPPEGDAPLTVLTDAQRLTQVFLNLLSNAIRASPKGKAVIVSVTQDEAAVYVQVADQGPGIPPHLLPRLFIPFAAADGDADVEASLGLPLSHSLATALGGALTVTSQPGRGSTFTVTLPRR